MGKDNKDNFWNGFVQGMQMNPITMLLLSIGAINSYETNQNNFLLK